MFLPDQATQVVHETPSLQVAGAALLLGAGQFLTWLSGRRRGNHGKAENAKAFERVEKSIVLVEKQVAMLSAHVIGPDGENGIRGDVREIKKQVDGILDRERNALQNPPVYDRRAQR